jgi:hypothetical protein
LREVCTDSVIELLLLKPAHAHDLKDGKGIRQRPECGHDNETENNLPAPQKRGADPEKMGDENTGTHPVCIMDLPPGVNRIFKQLYHAGPLH